MYLNRLVYLHNIVYISTIYSHGVILGTVTSHWGGYRLSPLERVQGHHFIIEILGNGNFSILKPSQCALMSHCFSFRGFNRTHLPLLPSPPGALYPPQIPAVRHKEDR